MTVIGGNQRIQLDGIVDNFGRGAGHHTVDANSEQGGDYQNEVKINGKTVFVTDKGIDAIKTALSRQGVSGKHAQDLKGNAEDGFTLKNGQTTVTKDPSGWTLGNLLDKFGDHKMEKETSGKLP